MNDSVICKHSFASRPAKIAALAILLFYVIAFATVAGSSTVLEQNRKSVPKTGKQDSQTDTHPFNGLFSHDNLGKPAPERVNQFGF